MSSVEKCGLTGLSILTTAVLFFRRKQPAPSRQKILKASLKNQAFLPPRIVRINISASPERIKLNKNPLFSGFLSRFINALLLRFRYV